MSCIGCVPTSENEKQTPSKGVLGDEQVKCFLVLSILDLLFSFVVAFTSLVFFCLGKFLRRGFRRLNVILLLPKMTSLTGFKLLSMFKHSMLSL